MRDWREYEKRILVTGGAGFIGSHLVRHFVNKYPNYLIVNFDALTYAGNLENLKDIEKNDNYVFINGDIRYKNDLSTRDGKIIRGIEDVFGEFKITDVIHLAAESHVDRSISDPDSFVFTNVVGTINLLNVAREFWKYDYSTHRFHHVSTDEVYGALDMNPENKFTEETPYNPHSPYSSSKASSDHFVQTYHDTYGMNITISNCSNNYGPNQFPEKLIPLAIDKLSNNEKIPVYGKGENVRDWLYVEDHVRAIDLIFHNGRNGEKYNIGGKHELMNIDIVNFIASYFDNIKYCDYCRKHPFEMVDWQFDINDYITYVSDRPGHDLRYAIDCSKLQNELGWYPLETFDSGMRKTIKWYLDNKEWMKNVKSGEYQNWLEKNYKNREEN